MRIQARKIVKQCKIIDISIKCDICGKIIADIDHENEYYQLVTGHHDWGNDSCESVRSEDICSNECLQKRFDKYLREEAEGSYTAYFEVNKAWGRRIQYEKED